MDNAFEFSKELSLDELVNRASKIEQVSRTIEFSPAGQHYLPTDNGLKNFKGLLK